MTQKIQLRRDLSTSWSSANPTLASGEIAIEADYLGNSVGSTPTWLNNGAVRLKVGDGQTTWSALPYSSLVADGTYAVGAASALKTAVISIGSGTPVNFHGQPGDVYFNMAGTTTAASGSGFNTIYQCRGTATTSNVTTVAGSNTLTSSAGGFNSGMIGQKVQVTNAGNSGPLSTTWIGVIATVPSSTQVTVTNGNSTNINASVSLTSSSQTVTISSWVGIA